MTVDMSTTIQPRSDQLNFDDVAAQPMTVTITEVRKGTAEQPVEIHVQEFPGRPYKPSKSMRRVLVAAWGAEAASYAGRILTIYGDPTVKFGGEQVGGIKISHLSHIDKPVKVVLTVTRGKRATHVVKPLEDTPSTRPVAAGPTPEQVATCTDINQLRDWHDQVTHPRAKAAIEARVQELQEAGQ